MAVAGQSIEAVLTLDATSFRTGIDDSLEAVKQLERNISAFSKNTSNMTSALSSLDRVLGQAVSSLTDFDARIGDLSKFQKFASAINNIANALRTLSREEVDSVQALNTINSMFQMFSDVMGTSTIKVEGLSSAIRQLIRDENNTSSTTRKTEAVITGLSTSINTVKSSFVDYGRIRNQIIAEDERQARNLAILQAEFNNLAKSLNTENVAMERTATATIQYAEALEIALPPMRQMVIQATGVGNALNKVEKEELETASATDKATQSMNRQSSATSRLHKAMSSLKMIGTMVASMMVWNFGSSLVNATRETVNAKSEMEGYFQMLHFSTSQVNNFNKALDETVAKFPRLNKYALGETISSIGVEFELTTKEMEKAMPVVSMITSEYLRAGRNVNEASLAVKDILQGEFQRLSRETGVKGDQLKEAGWSGDKSDVMGLLEALDKVGRSRNWDTFVTKANSLNDAVLILQNRFGEWSADMVNVVQPTILAVFNSLMSTGEGLSQSLSGLWKWLNGGSWGALASKIGIVSSAIITLMPLITAWRSGSSLLAMSNLTLSQSLTALIFGINAETLATTGSSSAIGLKILGLEAEELAEISVGQAIASRILGIEAEALTTAEATLVNEGFVGSLYTLVTGEVLAEAETLSFSGALAILTGTFLASPIGWFTLAILGLASAFYVLSGGLSDTWGKMKQFNETMKNPNDTIKPYQDRVTKLTEQLDEAKSKYGENSKEVEKLQKKLDSAKDTYDAVYHSIQHGAYWNEEYTTSFEELGSTMDSSLRDVMKSHGYSKEQIDESGKLLDSLSEGSDRQYHALQVLKKQQADASVSLDTYADKLDKAGIKGNEASESMSNYASNLENLQYHSAIANTSEDWWEWLWNSFYAGMDQFWIDWDNFWIDPQWSGAIDGLYRFLDMRFGITELLKAIGIDIESQSVGEIITGFFNNIGKFFEDKSLMDLFGLDENKDYVGEFFDTYIVKPIMEFDWIGSIENAFNMIAGQITGFNVLDYIFDLLLPEGVSASDGSSDHPSFMEDVSNIIGFDIQSWVESFNADPLGTLGIELPKIDILGLIKGLLPSGDDGGGGGGFNLGQWLSDMFNIDGVVSYFTTNLSGIISSVTSTASTVSSTFSGLKSNIQGHLTGIATNVSTGFENAKNYANTKITAMRDSVKSVIDQMTGAWKSMKDSILDSAKLIYDGVKSKFDSVKNTLSDFFTKLQNPSQWGSGFQPYSRQPKPQTARRLFSGVSRGGKHGAGVNPYTQSSTKKMSIKDLVDMVGVDEQVNIAQFLALFSGGFGGWDFHKPSKDKIFNTGKEWKSGAPTIQGIGTVGEGYKVARFWDGKPSFTFSEFEQVAQAVFSAIPYKFYYDSEWKGDWVSALLSGAVNCWDGANALIALARLFGFDGYPVHTTTKGGVGHFYAMIGGKAMDTTHFQNSGSWSPLGGAGIPTRTSSYNGRGSVGNSTTQNINITITGDVYGEEDFISKIRSGAREVMREEFNDPYTIAL